MTSKRHAGPSTRQGKEKKKRKECAVMDWVQRTYHATAESIRSVCVAVCVCARGTG